MRKPWFVLFFSLLACSNLFAAETSSQEKSAQPVPNFFAEQFYLVPDQRIQFKTSEVDGIILVPSPQDPSRYSLITDFGPGAIKSQSLPSSVEDLAGARKWIDDNLQAAEYHGVEIRRLSIPVSKDHVKTLYWVGQKSFQTEDEAKAQIILAQNVAESQGGNFKEMVRQAQLAYSVPESTPAVEIKTKAQFEKEEELALKFFDQLDVGNELYGPLEGTPTGEKIVWQSFGETTWRNTNLEDRHFNSQVGFWTNRVIFKGIRAPLNTIDPFIEITPAMESNGVSFKNNMQLVTGVEWRPFARNPWLNNFRPWGLPLLDFVKSYRFFVEYITRVNLRDPITGSHNNDTIGGLSIFYEFGIDLPSVAELEPSSVPDYLRNYFWGEYFGDYHFSRTGLSGEDDFNALILNSSILIGIKLPGIPLPSNPINDEFVLMPYMRFEHVNNLSFSFPYQNRYAAIAGVRWMPFRSFKWKDNEWLYKTKVFAEYVGVGAVHNVRQEDTTAAIDYDFRVGVNFSNRRF